MWGVILYILAVIVGLVLFMCYEPKEEKDITDCEQSTEKFRPNKQDFRLSSLFNVLGISLDPHEDDFEAFQEHFHCFEEVSDACRKAGLEKTNLILGIDFTASNEWQGRKSFNQNCLHKTSSNKVYNPYQKVIWILSQALAPFADEDLIPAYGFGDSVSTDEEVFPFNEDESPCQGFQEVLDRYNEIVKGITLGGPTSFRPIIAKAIELVKQTNKYHILVIVADGQVTEEGLTIEAIVEASKHPISIIVVGVGDGPWDIMEEFDHRLPKRKFDNFRFVDYHKATFKSKNPDAAFALQCLMEVPDQYKKIKALGYILDPPPDDRSSDSACSKPATPVGSPKKDQSSFAKGSPATSPQIHRVSPHLGRANLNTGRVSPSCTPPGGPSDSPTHHYSLGPGMPRQRVIANTQSIPT